MIPRAARTAAHLEPGTELEVRVENGVVQLEPAVKPARLVKRGRLLVASDESLPPLRQEQVDQTLEEVRSGGSKPRR